MSAKHTECLLVLSFLVLGAAVFAFSTGGEVLMFHVVTISVIVLLVLTSNTIVIIMHRKISATNEPPGLSNMPLFGPQ